MPKQESLDTRLPDGTLTIRLLPGSLGERLLAAHERKLAKASPPKPAKRKAVRNAGK